DPRADRVGAIRDPRPRAARRVFDVDGRSLAGRCHRADVPAEPAAALRDARRSSHADDHDWAGHRPGALSRVPPGTPGHGRHGPELAFLRRAAPRQLLPLWRRAHGVGTWWPRATRPGLLTRPARKALRAAPHARER